jgi:CDP-glucose 4,6-dehydratase
MKVKGFDWHNQKVLVTGSSGFKGSWLCAALLRLGARVYGTIRNQRNPLSAYEILGLDEGVVKVSADISDRQEVYDLLNSVEPDVIFHLAAKALVPVSLRDPRRTFDVNIMGTLNIIEACRKLKVCSRLLVCSTDHVFGNVDPEELPAGGFDERSRVSYSGPYDTSKAAMELIVRSYHHTYWAELPAIGITRCANVFGFGDTNQRRVVPLFVRSAVYDHEIPLRFRQSGRQFIHITDTISGYIRAASSLDEGGAKVKVGKHRPEDRSPFTPTYHFAIEKYAGTPEPYIRMEPLAKQVATLFSAQIDDSQCVDYPANENKIQALNCRATREVLQWQVGKTFSDALKELGQWYEAESNRNRLRELMDIDLIRLIATLS